MPVDRIRSGVSGIGEVFCYNSATMDDMNKGLTALLALLSLPVLAALFFIVRGIYRHTIGKKMQTTLREDYQNEA
ncbi:MAG TPA: hypothetical protein VEP69_05140, partial [Thermodesulfovibrionales bacterium]|nr:hypothetical protein [Thermodesulfovibrionales bacterium]